MRWFVCCAVGTLAVALLAGCGDTDCGAGTVDQDGVCVPQKKPDSGQRKDGGGKLDAPGGDAEAGATKCGNGTVEGAEACDDGNVSNYDHCLTNCKKNVCGDGYVNPAVEQCDDANSSNEDYCVAGCKVFRCGDGYIFKGVEDCDDGNVKDGDTCPANCRKLGSGKGGKLSGKVFRFGVASHVGSKITLAGTTLATTTAADGSYVLSNVPMGIYQLQAAATGYQPQQVINVTSIPGATYQVADMTLYRAQTVDTAAKWAGLSAGDKYLAWIDLSGTLRQRAAASATAKATLISAGVKTAAYVGTKDHLLYLTTTGDLMITAAASILPIKVASKVISYWFAKQDGWLLVRTSGNSLIFASPDGAKVHTVTTSYRGYRVLKTAKQILVYGSDGLRTLPLDGGAPVVLDVKSGDTYCGLSVTKSSSCNFTTVGLTKDQSMAYYYVRTNAASGVGALRAVSTKAGPAKKVIDLDWSASGASASVTLFGTTPHLAVLESGTKTYSWRRLRVAPLSGGKVLLVGNYTASSSNQWYYRAWYGADGGSVAVETYQYNSSSYRRVRLYRTNGSGQRTVVSGRYIRQVKYSPDGKHLALIYSTSTSSSSYRLVSTEAKASGSTTTHYSSLGSYYSYWSMLPLNQDILIRSRSSGSSYQVRRVAYNSTSLKTLASCTTSASLYSLSGAAALYRCRTGSSSSSYSLSLYRSGQSAGKTLATGSSISYSVAPDYSAVLAWGVASGSYNYMLANTSNGSTSQVAQNQTNTFSYSWIKLASGSYMLYMRPSSYSTGKHGAVLCGDPKTTAVKVLGKTSSSPSSFTTKAGGSYVVFADHSSATSQLVLANLAGCVVHKADSGATSYSGYKLTPDNSSLLFSADSALKLIPLAGGSSVQLAAKGTYLFSTNKYAFISGHAATPKGTIAAVLAVPLAGGNTIPIDYSIGSYWKGENDVLYVYSGLKYLDLQ